MPEDYHLFDSHQWHSFWESHVEQWRNCDLSQAAYCRSHHLKAHQFYHWRRRILAPQNEVSFLPVALSGGKAHNHPLIRIHTPNGFTIEIENQDGLFEVNSFIATVASL